MSDIDIARGRAHGRSRRPLQSIFRKKKRERFRGTPPPLPFDIHSLPIQRSLLIPKQQQRFRRSNGDYYRDWWGPW